MKVTVSSSTPASAATDVLVVPVWSDGKLAQLSPSLRQAVRQQMRRLAFNGAWGGAEFFGSDARGVRASFIAVVGLGERKRSVDRQAEGMRRAIARVVREMGRVGVRRMAVLLPAESANGTSLSAAVVDGAVLTSYRFTEYSAKARSFAASRQLRQVTLLVDREQVGAVREAVEREEMILRGVELARELVNQPASEVTPRALVEKAEALVRGSKRISLKVLNRAEATKEGFNAFLAVARGSSEEPYVIHLTYAPRRREMCLRSRKFFWWARALPLIQEAFRLSRPTTWRQ
jgi:leucyl aminopeptidase